MSKFYRTGKGGIKAHSHIVYVHPESQRVLVGQIEGHVHQVQFNPDGSFILLPDADGHSHEGFEEVKFEPKKKKAEDDTEVINRVYTLFKTAWENEYQSIKDGQESEKFYAGEQWDASAKQALEADGRACLTLNWCQKHVDDLLGYQRKQRTDIRYLPIEGGDQRTADLMNIMAKVLLENCNYEQEESQIFEDQAIPGRGVFNMYVSFKDDFRGEVKVERWPWDMAVFGPHEKPDGSDAEYVVKYKWQSLGKLRSQYPKKADDINEAYDTLTRFPSLDTKEFASNQYAKSTNIVDALPMIIGGTVPIVDVALKELRVFELQEKVYEKVGIIVDPVANVYQKAEGLSPKELRQIETLQGLGVVETTITKVRVVTCVGNVLLSDTNPAEMPYDDFTCWPVYAKRKRNKFWGKIEIAKDAQREVNKRASQSIDIGNRMANYIWFVDQGTFPTTKELQHFKNNANKPGFVSTVNSTMSPPVKVEGTKFPGEIVGLMEMAETRLGAFLSVNATSKAGANTSASAIMQAEQSVLVGSEFLFDNLSFAKRKLGRALLWFIRRYYDPQRIYRIVANQDPSQQLMIGDQPMASYSQEEIMAMLSNEELAKLDVAVGEANWSPTQRLATLQIVTEAMSKGAPVPFEVAVDMMDLPKETKDKILQGMQMERQSQADAESKKAEAEVQKTLISKGVVTQKAMQEYGIDPQQAQMLMSQSAPKITAPSQGGPGGLI